MPAGGLVGTQRTGRHRTGRIPDTHVDFDVNRTLLGDRRRNCAVYDCRNFGDGAGPRRISSDQFVGGQVGRVLTDRVREHHVVLMKIGKIRGSRTAIDDDDRAAFDIGSGNRIDHAECADAVGDRDGAKPFRARIPVSRVTGLQIAGGDDASDALADRRIEQRRAICGGHAEQCIDLLFLQPCQNVVGDGESHGIRLMINKSRLPARLQAARTVGLTTAALFGWWIWISASATAGALPNSDAI